MKHGILILLALALGTSTLDFSATEETSQKKKPESKAPAVQKASQKVKDPVCGMEIDTKEAAGKSTYKGKNYYFCSINEKEQFDKEPAKYVK
jgi:YHS domain-containing protein